MKPGTPEYWAAWVDGWASRPPDDLTGYRTEREVYAVAVMDALLAACERHILAVTQDGGPGVGDLGAVTSEYLHAMRLADPRMFIDAAGLLLGTIPPMIEVDAYIAWRDRQEQSDG